jgi:uncharacterized protein (DUF4415 family)
VRELRTLGSVRGALSNGRPYRDPAARIVDAGQRVDQDVIEWFKAQGPGYQTRINSVLRAFRDASAA